MARYLFQLTAVTPAGSYVRLDSASGSTSPTAVSPIDSAYVIPGAIIKSDAFDGSLPRVAAGVSTLYQKTLSSTGSVTATATLSGTLVEGPGPGSLEALTFPIPVNTGTEPKLAGPNTWTGTQDFTGATVTGVSGGGGAATAITQSQQSGTTYTLVLADAGTLVEFTGAVGATLTIPPNSSVAFPTGTFISLRQYGAGQVTVVGGAGVTLRSRGAAYKTGGTYAEATLTKRGTDEWVLTGDVTV